MSWSSLQPRAGAAGPGAVGFLQMYATLAVLLACATNCMLPLSFAQQPPTEQLQASQPAISPPVPQPLAVFDFTSKPQGTELETDSAASRITLWSSTNINASSDTSAGAGSKTSDQALRYAATVDPAR